ncbi:MAG: hypothetical protein ABI369_09755 [Acetobacteraceae bacterium]
MIRLRTALALMGLVATTGYAGAQQPTQAQIASIRQLCQTDYREHCSSVPTGGSAALACLRQNAAQLSPKCAQAVSATGHSAATPPMRSPPPAPALSPRQKAAMLREDCAPDYREFCRGVRPGGGQAIACLRDNAQSLSPPCQQALMAARR